MIRYQAVGDNKSRENQMEIRFNLRIIQEIPQDEVQTECVQSALLVEPFDGSGKSPPLGD